MGAKHFKNTLLQKSVCSCNNCSNFVKGYITALNDMLKEHGEIAAIDYYVQKNIAAIITKSILYKETERSKK